jgi:hypothetical protein
MLGGTGLADFQILDKEEILGQLDCNVLFRITRRSFSFNDKILKLSLFHYVDNSIGLVIQTAAGLQQVPHAQEGLV